MNVIQGLLIGFCVFCVGLKCFGLYLDEQAKVAAHNRHVAYVASEDARLRDACAKHQTGIVIYYKGKFCDE